MNRQIKVPKEIDDHTFFQAMEIHHFGLPKYRPKAILLMIIVSPVLRNPMDSEYPDTTKNSITASNPLKIKSCFIASCAVGEIG